MLTLMNIINRRHQPSSDCSHQVINIFTDVECQNIKSIINYFVVKLKVKPFNISIVVVYAPTAQTTEEEIRKCYCTRDNAKF